MAIYITRNVCELSNKETANIFGGIKEDRKLARKVKQIENKLTIQL